MAPTAKFYAPGLDLRVALQVGRVTFHWMVVLEVALAGLLLYAGRWKSVWPPIAILVVEWVAVMPALDARTVALIRGDRVGANSLHTVFIALELLKLGMLLWLLAKSNSDQLVGGTP